MRHACLRASLILLFLASLANGQFKDTKHGFSFKPPKDYIAVALSPNDNLKLAHYQDPQVDYGGDQGRQGYNRQYEISFWSIGSSLTDSEDEAGDGGDEGGDEEAPPEKEPPKKAAPKKSAKDSKAKQGDEEETPEDSLDAFIRWLVELRFGYCEVTKEKDVTIAGGKGREMILTSTQNPLKIYLVILEQPDGRWVFQGSAITDRFDKAVGEFGKATRSFARIEKKDQTSHDAALGEMSEQDRFLQKQIDKLPPGWSSLRTKRYLFLYDAEKSVTQDLATRIEAMRDVYELHYPRQTPIEDISIVRVCKDVEEYTGYGGPDGSGGYWNWRDRELVLFDHRPREFTLGVLNHEAFHQFIYYFYGQLSPHSWYNEGTGDYYAGAKLTKSNRVTGYGDGPAGLGRLSTVKEAARLFGEGKSGAEGASPPLKQVMRFHQSDYYGSAGYDAGICYAVGWGIVHYLREGKSLDPKVAKILPDYLAALVAAREEEARTVMAKTLADAEAAEAGSSEKLSHDVKDYYGRIDEDKTQDIAADKTFKDWTDDDWAKFQAAWLKYIEKL